MKNLTLLLLIGFGLLSACKKDSPNPDKPAPKSMQELVVPDGFDYQTTREIQLNINLRNPQNEAVGLIPVSVYDKPASLGGKVLFTTMADATGLATGRLVVPSYLDYVFISPNYVGLPNDLPMSTQSGQISMTVGGPNATPVTRTAADIYPELYGNPGPVSSQRVGATFTFLASFTTGSNGGVPSNLITPRDVITQSMLDLINASLPEQKPVPVNHPDYLNPNANINVQVTELADVWITFVHEGAGYKNSLGYYLYDTNNPPSSPADISEIKMILPNASLINSGGGLRPGDKVLIGRFPAGKTVGFAMISNGWTGTTVSTSAVRFYSDKNLNPEVNPANRQHHVLLYDDINKLFLIGFEDINRENPSCDQDFNDLVFYVTSNPVRAISTVGVNPIDQPIDTDGDGVSDVYDRFPTDPNLAYYNVFPAENTFGTLAFEDLWPGEGDYDMNDLVLDYQYRVYSNAQNNVRFMEADFAIRAIGGTIRSGFAFQMPVNANLISSVSGQQMSQSYFVRAANGTESGVAQAVIPVFDNAHQVSPLPAPYFLNTERATPFRTPDTVKIRVNFNTGLLTQNLGTGPFNPFIVANRSQEGSIVWDRGREIHLPGYPATSKANIELFNTSGDNTRPAIGKWYKTHRNLPFALHMAEKFEYSVERKSVLDAYPRFADWSQSGGTQAKDWYSPISVNRNPVHIY